MASQFMGGDGPRLGKMIFSPGSEVRDAIQPALNDGNVTAFQAVDAMIREMVDMPVAGNA